LADSLSCNLRRVPSSCRLSLVGLEKKEKRVPSPKKIYELDLTEQRLRTISFNEKSATLHFGKSEIKTIEIEY